MSACWLAFICDVIKSNYAHLIAPVLSMTDDRYYEVHMVDIVRVIKGSQFVGSSHLQSDWVGID